MKPQVSTPSVSRKAAVEPRVYLPRLTIRWLADQPDQRVQGNRGHRGVRRRVRFHRMSERLARNGRVGAEEVADVIGDVFAQLLTTAYDNGGSLLKFGGDALLLLFAGPRSSSWRSGAAVGMRAALRGGRPDRHVGREGHAEDVGRRPLGDFQCFLVGDSHRELIIAGPAMTTTVEMEGGRRPGEIGRERQPPRPRCLPACSASPRGDGFLLRRRSPLPDSSGLRLSRPRTPRGRVAGRDPGGAARARAVGPTPTPSTAERRSPSSATTGSTG